MIPALVKEGGSGRVDGNKKRASRIHLKDYEDKFVEISKDRTLQGFFGKEEKLRTVRSQSRKTITLEENSQSPGSIGWKRNFTFDLTQTIEFVGGACSGDIG